MFDVNFRQAGLRPCGPDLLTLPKTWGQICRPFVAQAIDPAVSVNRLDCRSPHSERESPLNALPFRAFSDWVFRPLHCSASVSMIRGSCANSSVKTRSCVFAIARRTKLQQQTDRITNRAKHVTYKILSHLADGSRATSSRLIIVVSEFWSDKATICDVWSTSSGQKEGSGPLLRQHRSECSCSMQQSFYNSCVIRHFHP
jgi:hypothetical protein